MNYQDAKSFPTGVEQVSIDPNHQPFPYTFVQVTIEKFFSFLDHSGNVLSYPEHQRSVRCRAIYRQRSDPGFVSLLFWIRQ